MKSIRFVFIIFLLIPFLFCSCKYFPLKKEEAGKAKEQIIVEATPIPTQTPIPVRTKTIIKPEKKENFILKIGKKKIDRQEFEQRYTEYLILADPDREEILNRKKFLDKFVRDELIRRYAIRERIDREPAFKAILEKEKQKLLVDYILQHRLLEKVNVSDEEIEWYYNEKIDEFTKQAIIQVRHIVTSTSEEANEVQARLDGGEDFADVARNLSIHSSRNQGGRLPPFSRGIYDPDFENAAFPMKVGEISGIIKTDLGYHIIEKTGETPETTTPLEEVKGRILEKIVQEKRARALKSFEKKLKKEIDVQVLGTP
jgi:peptidyl-prolyl cis-trans isomerase C